MASTTKNSPFRAVGRGLVAVALGVGSLAASAGGASAASLGAPTVVGTANPPTGTLNCMDANARTTVGLGAACSFTLTPNPADGVIPVGYTFQQDWLAPVTVTVSSPGNGNTFDAATGVAVITVITAGQVNDLTVSEIAADGRTGVSTRVQFDTAGSKTSVVDDITNDGRADLLMTPSAGSSLRPGLWLATGNGGGMVDPVATDIGNVNPSPGGEGSTWDGVDAIIGNFCGNGLQDVLAYNPGVASTTVPNAGGGFIRCNSGNAHTLEMQEGTNLPSNALLDMSGNDPTQLADAGDTSGNGTGLDDLFATIGNQLFLFSANVPGGYGTDADFGPPVCQQSCAELSATPTPDGTYDWNSWTIATMQRSDGTAMYLWKPSTGALYLWTGLVAGDSANDGVFPNYTTLTHATYEIKPGGSSPDAQWNMGKSLHLQVVDLNGDGVPDIWAVDPTNGRITTYLASINGSTATLHAEDATQTLVTPDHNWVLNDRTFGSAGTGLDGGYAPLPLTGNAGVSWNVGDRFSPDAAFNGSSGYLTTNGPAVVPTADFTVSAQVEPTAPGGVVLSQAGTDVSAFRVALTADGHWSFGMAGSTYTQKTAGRCRLGAWSHVTLTYHAATGALLFYIDGERVGGLSITGVPSTSGNFVVGAEQTNGQLGSYFTGHVARVEVWSSTLTAAQIAKLG